MLAQTVYGGNDETQTRDLCRDSTEASSNLLKLSVTDGFFWRSEMSSVTVIGLLSDPRPLPCRLLPKQDSCLNECIGLNARAELQTADMKKG